MWELLQKIENLGWKPYGKSIAELSETEKNVRLITSRNSGLWQFLCENGMVKNVNDYSWELYSGTHGQNEVYKNGYEGGKRWEQVDYEYRIIESALCNEEALEEFLLENIKIS